MLHAQGVATTLLASASASSVVTQRPYRVAVVGAGAAGAACASRLLQRSPNLCVRIYDQGARGPGGRACPRPVDGKGASFSPDDKGGGGAAVPGLSFDHGVQAVQVSDPAVRAAMDGWVADGIAAEWRGKFGELEAGIFRETSPGGEASSFCGLASPQPRFVGTPSNGAWVEGMLPADDARLERRWVTKVASIDYERHDDGEGRWRLREAGSGDTYAADVVVCATHAASMVADAAAKLPEHLSSGGGTDDDDDARVSDAALRAVSYPDGVAPLYALMAAFDEGATPLLPFDGAAVVGDADLAWISKQSSKPSFSQTEGEAGEVVVALSTEAFARRMQARPSHVRRASEEHLKEAATELLGSLARALGLPAAATGEEGEAGGEERGEESGGGGVARALPATRYVHAQRWAAGLTRAPLGLSPPRALWRRAGLVGCGDWAGAAARFEGAVLSGWAAADAAAEVAAAAATNRALISVERATEAQVEAAAAWPVWSCEAWQPPAGGGGGGGGGGADGAGTEPAQAAAGRFQESRWWEARPGVGEERCHVFEGRATLLPQGGGAPLEIGAGDWVTFRVGFECEWVVTEPIAKRYAYYCVDGSGWVAP